MACLSCSNLFFLLFFLTTKTVARSDGTIHLRFYMHDKFSSPNPTDIKVVPSGAAPETLNFGDIAVLDDLLTKGPDPSSGLAGRVQGSVLVASLTGLAVLLTVNIVFADGKFNGSTLAVMGRQDVSALSELPIAGGTGKFRKARGYVLMRRSLFDSTAGSVIVELDAYVDA